ncbi:MAG TPA: VanW family protein [Acidimicrobiales bacterium]|nr:VanW family protein [Acidimicrobiales bacterium]
MTIGLIALASLFGVGVAVVIAYTVDTSRNDGKVARNVELAGRDIGGMTRQQVVDRVAALADTYANSEVRVDAPEGGFTAPATDLGVTVTDAATVEAAFKAGRTGAILPRIADWVGSFFGPRQADVKVAVAPGSVYKTVAERDPGPKTPAAEPSIKVESGKLVAVEGKSGRGIDPADVVDKLPKAARRGAPIRVRVDRGEVEPRFDKDDVEKLVEEAAELVRTALPVKAGTAEVSVPAATLRTWLRANPAPDGLVLAVDANAAADDLKKLLPNVGTPPTESSFTVTDGVPRVIAGKSGTGCCAPTAGALLLDAMRTRPKNAISLPLTRVEPKLTVEKANALGIREKVGEFTTTYQAGQPRVTNIHRISNLARGHVILPGETYSVNERIGRRTREKGFVVAGVIQDGMLAEDVGGGVSQFATTFFNAAFFAGLDFGEYQSHSLYFSRYPRGREATLGFPHPDLQIKNTTQHGVLVWPTYSSTTITVTLYSTKHIESVQTGQSEAPRGPCTRVTTQRTRTYPDGTKKTDSVFALYRPEEGVNCP